MEGVSDRLAVLALADLRGWELAGIEVLAMGGVTNIGRFVRWLGPQGLRLRLAGLCDAGEVGHVQRALERGGVGSAASRRDLESLGFFVCDADLEDELIRALGVPAVLEIVDAQGELRAFRSLQQQPAQRGRTAQAQLRRFMGSRGGRKIQYAPLLVNALPAEAIPAPLDGLLAALRQ